jgi:uncharacterized membrane protein YhiD involved in acid resistance
VIAPATIVIRLALALACGTLIGVERELRQKHAGLKTMALVALGAAAFAMMSDTFGPTNHNPAQIAAAVVGGIGFIGAGVIMRRGFTVQGVTTAATLWADSSVGVAAGLGQYPLALILSGGIVVVQFMVRKLETVLLHHHPHDRPGRFEFRVECEPDALQKVNEIWSRVPHVQPLQRTLSRGADHVTLRVVMLTSNGALDFSRFEEMLVGMDGVRRVDVRHLGIEED